MIAKLREFFVETIWRLDLAKVPWALRLLIRPLRFAVLAVRCYVRDGSRLHASALTYITMLAVVPVLALGLTSLKAFGAGEVAEAKMMERIEVFVGSMAEQDELPAETATDSTLSKGRDGSGSPSDSAEADPDSTLSKDESARVAANALRDVCRAVFDQIDSINFAKIGTLGAVVLIFMVIGVLGKIENSFNAIWGIGKARSLWRKFTDYLSVIIIAPLLVLAATSLPLLDSITRLVPDLWGIHGMIQRFGIFNLLLPLFIGTCLFAFLFGFLPNTRVKVSSCFCGAFVTTVVLVLFFKLCMVMQIGVANNSRLYGSLIALPILLFWIYSSWQIILFGAEICYVHHHYAELLRESAFTHPSERDRIVLALALVLWAAKCVEEESGALAVEQFADTFSLPERDVSQVALILERNRILLPVAENGSSVVSGYVLSRCATRLTVADVINACLDDTPGEDVLQRASNVLPLTPLSALEARFSAVLSAQFPMTIAEALHNAKESAKA